MSRASWIDRGRRLAGPLLLALFAAALLLLCRAAEQSPDALDCALDARDGVEIFHPHHLLFVPLVRLALRLLAPFGVRDDAILAGQIHNVAWALVALLSLLAIARRLFTPADRPQSRGAALAAFACALLLLFARGFWAAATTLEPYVPALGCLTLLTWLLIRDEDGAPAVWRPVAAGVLFALAILYHQTSLLFALPLLAWSVAARGRQGWLRAGATLAVAGSITLAVYVPAARLAGAGRSVRGFLDWALSFAQSPVPGWGSFAHARPSGIAALLDSQLADLLPVPSRLALPAAVAFGLGLTALAIWHARAVARGAPHRPLRLLCLAWLVADHLFFLWWLPTDTDFFIATLAPLILLVALAAADLDAVAAARAANPGPAARSRRAAWTILASAILAGLCAVNLLGSVWRLHASRGSAYAEAERLSRATPPGCVIGTTFGVRENLRYHFRRTEARDLDLPLLAAYGDRVLTPRAEGDCLVLPAELLRPGRGVADYSGANRPQAWLAWLSWLLAARYDERGRPVSCLEPIVQSHAASGGDFVVVGPGRVAVDGLEGLAALLDSRLIAVRGWSPGRYGLWLRAARMTTILP